MDTSTVALLFVPAVLAALIIFDRFTTRRSSEWRGLAEARGAKIEDLECRVARLEAKIEILEGEMAMEIAALVVTEMKAMEGGYDR